MRIFGRFSSIGQLVAGGLFLLLISFAVVAPAFLPDPTAQDLMRYLSAPDVVDWLGRDHYGRSVLARLAAATRLSLGLSLLAVLISAILGCCLGLLAAYYGKWLDAILRSIADAVLTLPPLLLVLLFAAIAQGGISMMFIGLAFSGWVEYFRMSRSTAAVVVASQHVEASRLLGFGLPYLVRRHLWPAIVPTILPMMMFGLASNVVALATLGFVGVGVQPPTPELGQMLTEALPHYAQAPWMIIGPMAILAILLLSCLLWKGRHIE
ncbi:ABC transporter permease [Leeia sp. TBRC 13508]|uniref:ABC transporter permease n=1 Tax=Leeia speluncae TaxID=2884804 RepID=A0ABS8D3G6_9NEIS|nr:ABC transporter permease [Leeia speluncae]MCB6182721.1 ABC transporter permease [Leeia speluncae]